MDECNGRKLRHNTSDRGMVRESSFDGDVNTY